VKTVRFLLILLLFSGKITFAEDTRPVITELNKAIQNKEAYCQKKEKRIARFKEVLSRNLSPLGQYTINRRLCEENHYRNFTCRPVSSDSAFFEKRRYDYGQPAPVVKFVFLHRKIPGIAEHPEKY